MQQRKERQSLYSQITARIIAELEAGGVPWVQPWDSVRCGCSMPRNAVTGRGYSGINVLILWAAGIEGGYSSHRWLTYRQAQTAGGSVRKGEKGTSVCYADRFTPKDEEERANSEEREARQIAFLKRFTVFNVDQCEGLPEKLTKVPAPRGEREAIPDADALIAATGADLRIGGDSAFYARLGDFIQVPPPEAYFEPINWYRTALHELGHWTGHPSRLARDMSGSFGTSPYAREELVAELACAFVCASLSIHPTVRHTDYIGAWLKVLKEDERAIFRAASLASKAADYLLGFIDEEARS
ncbi:ArdC family protein [Sphingosinicella sp. CPCC 101087]|uniref:ArdC family protein n=1 Tax=Sphingosinicella sp. CPCC 101087 TaxID=2497754 RepID=UPI00101D66FF|nr:zincin-like metallopeptidase domain-containing protein [Sphingosinicella sp. CPCC 101087]